VKDLNALAPYAAPGKPVVLADLYRQRKWLEFYGGAVAGRHNYSADFAALHLSPEYTDADIDAYSKGNEFTEKALLMEAINTDFSRVTNLDCPVILFGGRHDYNVSSTVAAEWLEHLHAPAKRFVWFEHSAHDVMMEEPGKVLVALVDYALPIAEQAGDVPH
jgi:proline iminopeptidase